MNFLLTSDLHFTDNAIENYRWKVFDRFHELIKEHKIDIVVIAGDLTDRKDRHSSLLVNRLTFELEDLVNQHNVRVLITMGNHDAPIQGIPFWEFLGRSWGDKIQYIQSPFLFHNVWLMPFSSNPVEDWKDLNFTKSISAVIIHQTISGAVVENNRVLETNTKLPQMKCKIFSGDVHRQQDASGITYIGAPYPVRFGEDWDHRVIIVKNKDFENYISVPVVTIKRTILDIQSTKELPTSFKQNDQVRIRYRLSSYSLADWPLEQAAIKKWADEFGVNVLSIEAVLGGEGVEQTDTKISKLETMSHEDVVRLFAIEKQLDPGLIDIGLQLVKESI